MANDFNIDWPGQSGKTYRYWSGELTGSYKDEGGNYMYVKRLANGNYLPVYIGIADSLKDRLANHDRLEEAKREGASLLMTHTTPAGELARIAEEKDLIQRWNPVLNTHHRKVS
jgi:predicted GIY-YIG superfamily endonuclease